MADKLMFIANKDTQKYPFCRLQLVVETFWNLTEWTNQSKCNKSPQVLQTCKNKKSYVGSSPKSPSIPR